MPHFVIIGGGAAGYFAAIHCKEQAPNIDVTILERGKSVLEKVRISGGGRCNLAHDCEQARELVKFYPRGGKALLGPFHRFGTRQTLDWFERHGVATKVEEDGRIFPVSDSSQTVVDTLYGTAKTLGVRLRTGSRVDSISAPEGENAQYTVHLGDGETIYADALMVAGGSSVHLWEVLARLGHKIVPPVPSLFTFNIRDPRIAGLAGLSVPSARVQVIGEKQLSATGALLITHWGVSAQSILRLSAWGARRFNELGYKFSILVDWAADYSANEVAEQLKVAKQEQPRRQVDNSAQFGLPSRLWQRLCLTAQIGETQTWATLTKAQMQALQEQIKACELAVDGKSTFKGEFVTAGGVDLDEVDFTRFESRLFPRLFFAGEILDIDAITGGFNFQAAWTGGYHVGVSVAESLTISPTVPT